ncbi:MAG: hypothetical protein P8R42_11460 [Candidatus Binatia bacterium]|nr:hypothetical protein [Candidatus Binatia bacterium]
MKNMVDAQNAACPFEFNVAAATFKVGDLVSYRVPESFQDMPFVGKLLEVHEDHVILHHYGEEEVGPVRPMRGSREDRPAVSAADALAD